MVDPFLGPCPLQRGVLKPGPDAAHRLDLRPAGLRRVEHASLLAEAVFAHHPGGGEHMGVVVAIVPLAMRRVDRVSFLDFSWDAVPPLVDLRGVVLPVARVGQPNPGQYVRKV